MVAEEQSPAPNGKHLDRIALLAHRTGVSRTARGRAPPAAGHRLAPAPGGRSGPGDVCNGVVPAGLGRLHNVQGTLPYGSSAIAAWAAQSHLGYEALPDEAWFRRWEPHDAIAPPARFLNACTWLTVGGHVVLVEPWYANEDETPLDRTVMAFAVNPELRWRAAARVGEHFITRVVYLEGPRPPTVTVGDPVWDAHVVTLAPSARDAESGFHKHLRRLLAGWGFEGHLELRPGGLVVHYAGLQPTPAGYDRLLRITREIVGTAVC